MKYGISIVAVAALMLAAPALADSWNGDGDGVTWNDPDNWILNAVPAGQSTTINNGDSVTLSGTAGDTNFLNINTGSTLTVTTDLDSGDDLLMDTGGTFNMNAGYYDQGEKFKLFGNGAGSTFNMNGGTLTVGNKLEIYNNSLLEISGGSISANDGDGIEDNGGIVRVIGDVASIYVETFSQGDGTIEFVPTASGGISTITLGGGVNSNGISVALDALTVDEVDMVLFSGGAVGALIPVTVTKDAGATVLVLGTDYTLDYVNGTDLGLKLSVIPEPATMSILAIGGLALLRRKRRA
jgi:hypothetical protein